MNLTDIVDCRIFKLIDKTREKRPKLSDLAVPKINKVPLKICVKDTCLECQQTHLAFCLYECHICVFVDYKTYCIICADLLPILTKMMNESQVFHASFLPRVCIFCKSKFCSDNLLLRHTSVCKAFAEGVYCCYLCPGDVRLFDPLQLIEHYYCHLGFFKCTGCWTECSSAHSLIEHFLNVAPNCRSIFRRKKRDESNRCISPSADSVGSALDLFSSSQHVKKCVDLKTVRIIVCALLNHPCTKSNKYVCGFCLVLMENLFEINNNQNMCNHEKERDVSETGSVTIDACLDIESVIKYITDPKCFSSWGNDKKLRDFKCHFCSKTFPSMKDLHLHKCVSEHYQCKKCAYETELKDNYLWHILLHRSDFVLTSLSSYRNLFFKDHLFLCSICHMSFNSSVDLKIHLHSHEWLLERSLSVDTVKYYCKECITAFPLECNAIFCEKLHAAKSTSDIHSSSVTITVLTRNPSDGLLTTTCEKESMLVDSVGENKTDIELPELKLKENGVSNSEQCGDSSSKAVPPVTATSIARLNEPMDVDLSTLDLQGCKPTHGSPSFANQSSDGVTVTPKTSASLEKKVEEILEYHAGKEPVVAVQNNNGINELPKRGRPRKRKHAPSKYEIDFSSEGNSVASPVQDSHSGAIAAPQVDSFHRRENLENQSLKSLINHNWSLKSKLANKKIPKDEKKF